MDTPRPRRAWKVDSGRRESVRHERSTQTAGPGAGPDQAAGAGTRATRGGPVAARARDLAGVRAPAAEPCRVRPRPVHGRPARGRTGRVLRLTEPRPHGAGHRHRRRPRSPGRTRPAPGRFVSGPGHGRPRDRAVRPAGPLGGHPRRRLGAACPGCASRRDDAADTGADTGGSHPAHALGPGPGDRLRRTHRTRRGRRPRQAAGRADGLVNTTRPMSAGLPATVPPTPLPTRPARARAGTSPLTRPMKETAS